MSPQIRQTIYLLGTLISAVMGIALVWGGIDQGTASNIDVIITGLLAFLGAGAPALAAKKVGEQKRDGTLTDSPTDQVVRGVQTVIAAHAETSAELERVKQAVTSAVGLVPGIGPLAAQVINSVQPNYGQR